MRIDDMEKQIDMYLYSENGTQNKIPLFKMIIYELARIADALTDICNYGVNYSGRQ